MSTILSFLLCQVALGSAGNNWWRSTQESVYPLVYMIRVAVVFGGSVAGWQKAELNYTESMQLCDPLYKFKAPTFQLQL